MTSKPELLANGTAALSDIAKMLSTHPLYTTGTQQEAVLATAATERELHEQRIDILVGNDESMRDIERRARNYAALNGFTKDGTLRFVHWALETAQAQDQHFRSLSPMDLRQACFRLGLMAAPIPRKVVVERLKASKKSKGPLFQQRLTKKEKQRLLKRWQESKKT